MCIHIYTCVSIVTHIYVHIYVKIIKDEIMNLRQCVTWKELEGVMMVKML